MIERLYLKELIGFESVDLEFDDSLVVFSGPSGAGKSVLMGAVLAAFGVTNAESSLCEVEIKKPKMLESEQFEIENESIIKTIKKDRVRYYLNEQNISRKMLKELFSPYINYLSVRDKSGFESDKLIEAIDRFIVSNNSAYGKDLTDFADRYDIFQRKRTKLQKILDDEKRLFDLIEFARFEVNKIDEIDPKIGEEEELLQLKKKLSKVDKINETASQVDEIFALEGSIGTLFDLIEKDGSYMWDALNQLRSDIEQSRDLAAELEEMDVEQMLDRLEKLNELKNRYGSIEDALEHRERKLQELESYEHIESDKSELESFVESERQELEKLAESIHEKRIKNSEKLAEDINLYLSKLKLPKMHFVFEKTELARDGISSVDIALDGSQTSTLSGGEFNRLRLSLMVASLRSSDTKEGVIILDEIDANVSGDESIAIADMLSRLAEHYQIFAISHQPHLSSKANQHILVEKSDGKSIAKVLDKDGRVKEISRIIGGQMPTDEAVALAKKMIE